MPITEQKARAELYRRATESWEHLKKTHRDTWAHYETIGTAMVEARNEIMRDRGLNQPVGPGYQHDMKAWLAEHRLADMEKGVRSRLCELIDHRSEIEQTMEHWTVTQRMLWNHPNTVHRRWKAWRANKGTPSDAQVKKLNAAQQTSQQLALALEQIEQQKAHIAELEAASDTASAEERKPMFDASDLLKRIEQQQAQIAELEAASGKASVARAGLDGPLEALVERMNDKGFGERDVPDFVESKPTFEPLDLIELAKWIRDFADYWKRYQRKIAKQSVAAVK